MGHRKSIRAKQLNGDTPMADSRMQTVYQLTDVMDSLPARFQDVLKSKMAPKDLLKEVIGIFSDAHNAYCELLQEYIALVNDHSVVCSLLNEIVDEDRLSKARSLREC